MEIIEHHRPAEADPSHPTRMAGRQLPANLILLCSLVLTLLAWWAVNRYATDETLRDAEQHTNEVHGRLLNRLAGYEQLLQGNLALVVANGEPDVSTWNRYVQSLEVGSRQPSIHTLGIARRTVAEWPEDPTQIQRRAGRSVNRALANTGLDFVAPTTFLAPADRRHRQSIGDDLYRDPSVREALEWARLTGRISLTAPQRHGSAQGQGEPVSFLLAIPIYRTAAGEFSPKGHPDQLWGWAFAGFDVDGLVSGLLGEGLTDVDLVIEDNSAGSLGGPFLHSRSHQSDRPVSLTLERQLDVGGREWQMRLQFRNDSFAIGTVLSAVVTVAGLAINLMLWKTIQQQAHRRQEAEARVEATQAQVRSRNQWLDAVSGLSPDGALVFESDANGIYRLVFTNPAFSHLFGLRPTDLLGLSEPAVDEWLEGLAGAEGTMPPLGPGEVVLELPGPPLRVLQRNRREDAHQRVYYFRDITHESEVDRLKSEFITTAAHELRTPLASVYGFSELMVNQLIPMAKREQAIEVVYRQAGVLKHLVDELMDLARLDARAGKDFIREHHTLQDLLGTAIESVTAPGAEARIRLSGPDDPLWMLGDATKLRQVLVNILTNAFKYSAEGTPVRVALRRDPASPSVGALIEVTDQGIGMTREQCDHAFERFYRADPSGHVLGAGLGLAISREIVELHGGRIQLDSEPGVGTRVRLWLPLSDPPADAARESEVREAASEPSPTLVTS